MKYLLIANPENRRVAFFQGALAAASHEPATVIAHTDWLAGRVDLAAHITPETVIRIESPGENPETQRQLLIRGARHPDASIDEVDAARVQFDRGRLDHPLQKALGWQVALQELDAILDENPHRAVMNHPGDVAMMFDKARTHDLFAQAGVPCAPYLGRVSGYEELREVLRGADCQRAFIKLRHGSSASGVVAYRFNDRYEEAITSSLMRPGPGGSTHIYNCLKIQRYNRREQIELLIDTLATQQVIVERWVPKARYNGKQFDVRAVVIDGRSRHKVARMSASPMTNLHLGNERGDLDELCDEFGDALLDRIDASAEAALAAFSRSLYAGVDVLVTPGGGSCFALEINAFGDLIPNLTHEGQDTYTAQVHAMDARLGEDHLSEDANS